MSDDKIFPDGLMFKAPREGSPDFVKGSISVKLREFFEFCKAHQDGDWLNFNVKLSRGGKLYCELDTWKPTKQAEPQQGFDPETGTGSDPMPGDDSDIPF